ncbi:N-acetylglucosaminyl-phosphatidylinositol de-N-acetylase isoform X3 [Mustelus asterias]
MEMLGLCLLAAFCSYCLWIWNIYHKHRGSRHPAPAGGERPGPGAAALLVTAHPDDECMFFAPALLGLVARGLPVHLLCLSTGNFYKQGEIRKKELVQSCAVLGLPSSRVTILDHRYLPDNPGVQWDSELIAVLILKHIQMHHISLETSLREETAEWVPSPCSPIHKCSPEVYLHPGPANQLAEAPPCDEAMYCHQSQLVWFRRLYLYISRYMFINTFHLMSQ